ncbi:MAG: MFS transporter [Lachnospiraceae bacterium]|nr:MFS transporter [Lachnospiraceae bacterium]
MFKTIRDSFQNSICLDRIIYVVLINVLFDASMYISLVVYALYVNQYVSLVYTSLIIAIPSFISLFSGPIPHILIKKFGDKRIMIFSFLCLSCLYFILSVLHSGWRFLVVSCFIGFVQLVIKPVLKVAFSNCAIDDSGVDLVHRIRYSSICVSGIIGPIAGGIISDKMGYISCFRVSGLIFLICAIMALNTRGKIKKQDISVDSFKKDENSIFKIKRYDLFMLILCIISGSLVYSVFIQFESVYSLVLKTVYDAPNKIFSTLIAMNSFLGLILQVFVMTKKHSFRDKLQIRTGIVLFQVAFFVFTLVFLYNNLSIYILFFGVFVYSLGEVIAIPGLDITIDKIAPDDKKNLYFGFAELRGIGFAFGPVIMGLLLEKFGAVILNLTNIFLLGIALFIEMYLGYRIKNRYK